MKKIFVLMVISLALFTGCSSNQNTGTDDDLKVASDAVQEVFNKKGVSLESDVSTSFAIANERIEATSKVIINILDKDSLVMKLPHGIDFGSLPVGQLGLENLNKEMIYLVEGENHTLFVEGKVSDQEKIKLDLDNMLEMAMGDNRFEKLKGNVKNFVVTKNGDETVYTYEIIDETFVDSLNEQLQATDGPKISKDDIEVFTTQSIHIENGKVTFINTSNTLMLDAGLLIGPEAGTLGNMTIDFITNTDLRSEVKIEIPELSAKEKSLD